MECGTKHVKNRKVKADGSSFAELLLNFIFPQKCPLCSEIIPYDPNKCFCDVCSLKVALIEGGRYCQRCGKVYSAGGVCVSCAGRRFAFKKNRAVSAYDESMRNVIYQFKYDKHPEHGRSLGRLMAGKYSSFFDEKVDFIVPVPLNKKKYLNRGYNQSELLAREVSAKTGIPLRAKILVRTGDTKPQSILNPREREENITDAFKYSKTIPVSGMDVLIIDDIFTTGSTISECAELLLANGAANVYGYTLAVTE